MRSALEKLADHDPGFQPGECGADAEVRALAKADVALSAGTIQAKFIGIVELRRIPVRRAPREAGGAIRNQILATQRGVVDDVAVVARNGGS